MPYAVFAPLIAFAVTLTVVGWLAHSRHARIALDRPNERSLHVKPVPRTGGLGLHAGVLLAASMSGAGLSVVIWVSMLALLAVSLIDDIRGLPIFVRLLVHLLACGAVAVCVLWPTHGPLAACIAAMVMTWMMNLYNFMDGADGLAGGMTLFGFGFYGIAAWHSGSGSFALFNFSIAAAAFAFLLFNFNPARIFMGDAGAVPLGFLAGALGLLGWLQSDWAWWFPILVFSPFIADATVTLLRRALRGARIWEAHREHYYQRLVRMGWGHRRTALTEFALMAICGSVALLGMQLPHSQQIAMLLAAAVLYALIAGVVDFAWHKYRLTQAHDA